MSWRERDYNRDDDDDVETPWGDSDDPDHFNNEDPDESDMDGANDEPDVVECPYCGESISELAEWCPRCERYISREDSPLRIPRWILWGTILAAATVLSWMLLM